MHKVKVLFCLSLRALALTAALAAIPASTYGSDLPPGVVIADFSGKVVHVDRVTGTASLVIPAGGLATPVGVVVEPTGQLLVSSPHIDAIVRVDPATGSILIVTSGNLILNPDGIALDLTGRRLFVSDLERTAIVEVDLQTGGQRQVRKDGPSTGQTWLAVGADGCIYVPNWYGHVYRVNPVTGEEHLVSTGGLLIGLQGIAVGPTGDLFIVSGPTKSVVRVDPVTGAQSLVSSVGYLSNPYGIAVDNDGQIFVCNLSGDSVVRIDSASGTQTLLPTSLLSNPYGLAIYGPPGSPIPGRLLPPPPPPAPSSFTASDSLFDGIQLTWSSVDGVQGYYLYRDSVLIAVQAATDTSYFDTVAVGSYGYCVQAGGAGGISDRVCDIGTRRDYRRSPRLDFVRDVPHDQGGKVVLGWLGSELDTRSAHQVTGYRVWRRIPPQVYGARIASSVFPAGRPGPDGQLALRMKPCREAVTYWEAVAELPAAMLEAYGYTASTLQDSLPGSNPYTAFFVSALTDDPAVFYDSEVDSGYSVDNLSPAQPAPFVAQYSPTAVALHWGANREPDLAGYRLYRGTTKEFVPSPANLLVAQADTGYTDFPGGITYYCYKLSAVDVHGNESRFACVTIEGPTAALATLVSADCEGGVVRLLWSASANPGLAAIVYRRTEGSNWVAMAHVVADGTGLIRYEDPAVTPGTRYGYRLGIFDGDREVFLGEAWVDVPALQLALHGMRPNPAIGGNVSVSFTLPSNAPTSLEMFDVSGRLVERREVGSLGPGYHEVSLGWDSRLRAGVYLLRLTQRGKALTAKTVVLP